MMRHILLGAGCAVTLLGATGSAETASLSPSLSCPSADQFTPKDPARCGFALIFDDEFRSLESIDVNATGAPGYKWYTNKFFGYATEPAANIAVANGVLTISPSFASGNYNLATAAPAGNKNGYIGTVFGPPAAAYYFEARIAFDQTLGSAYGSTGFPAFWGLAIEHMTQKGQSQWPGQAAGFEHFFEDDIFEYDTSSFRPANVFGSKRWEWHGQYNITCPGFCSTSNEAYEIGNEAPSADDWTIFHTIGQLWILGTAANHYQGSMTIYVDGAPALPDASAARGFPISWTGNPTGDQGAPPPTGAGMYSIVDQQHLNIILGTTPGWPMKVAFVRVWRHN